MFQIDRGNLIVMFTKRHKSQKKIDVMENINSVPSNVQSARQESVCV